MAEITLVAETGREPGSAVSRRLRKEGKVPAVVYGHGIEPISIAVDGRELRHALTGDAGLNALVNLEIGDAKHLTMARVLQRHPVRGTVVHVDFQVVGRDEVVHAEVPIHLVGEPKAVLSDGGVVEHTLTTLSVLATPARIPSVIEVDVSGLRVGDTIRVADLPLPAGVATELDPEEAVVLAQGQQVSDLDLIPEADADALKELADAQAAGGEGEGAAAGGGSGEGEAPGE
jgi:large subunit ribosomal protein L25